MQNKCLNFQNIWVIKCWILFFIMFSILIPPRSIYEKLFLSNTQPLLISSQALALRTIWRLVQKKYLFFFFSETISTVIIKFTHIMSTCFTKLRLFFYKASIINTLFPPLHGCCMLVMQKSLLKQKSFSNMMCFSLSSSTLQHPWSMSFRGPKIVEGGGVAQSGLEGGWRTNSRCRLPWVESWLVSFWPVKGSY